MVVATADEFLDLLSKSGLLESKQLEKAQAEAEKGGDVKALARRLVEAELLTEWQAGQLLVGRNLFFLGKYKLIKMLGRGGMGAVFLAEHVMMNRRVALKTISRKVSKEPAALKRFLTEARAVASLDHKNIVQAYSVDEEDERFFLVMELVDGEDLEQKIESEGPLDPGEAAEYICQAADGLEHGHGRKMIHCDIKPANLLLNHEGVVKIVDMGLAQLQDPSEARSKDKDKEKEKEDDQVLGTVDFLSPEQAMGGKDFDHRADIYSLGCTFYFLLTGGPPFPGGMLHEKLMKHQAMQPEKIDKLRSDVPDKVVKVCEKMMAKKPDDRYQSAAEVSKALEKFRATKRKAKPALRRAEVISQSDDGDELPAKRQRPQSRRRVQEAKGPALPLVQADTDSVASKQYAARKKSKSSQQVVVFVVVGVVVLALLALLIPFLVGSPETPTTDAGPRVPANETGGENGEKEKMGSLSTPTNVLDPLPPETADGPTGEKITVTPSASFCYPSDSLKALSDGEVPRTSNDESIPRLTFWDHKGTNEWVQYDFDKPTTVSSSEVYWFEDKTGCRVPRSHRLLYKGKDDKGQDAWKPVVGATSYGVEKDKYNKTTFEPIETSGLRMYTALQPNFSAGIVEWKINGQTQKIGAILPAPDQGVKPPVTADVGVKPPVGQPPVTKQPVKPPVPSVVQPTRDPARLVVLNMEQASDKLLDQSGNNHHGSARGKVLYAQPGKHGNALGFDGGHLILDGSGVFNHNADFTWTAWIKTAGKGTILAFTNDGGGIPNAAKCLFVSGGRLCLEVRGVGNLVSKQLVNDDLWHHIAVTAQFNVSGDNDTVRIFIDGKRDAARGNWNVNKHDEGNFIMKIGRCNDNFGEGIFNGLVDDVTVWNRVLAPNEIADAGNPEYRTFKGLGKTGNLAPLDEESTSASHVLGKLTVPEGATVDLQLLGGHSAIRGKRHFLMEPAEDNKYWAVDLVAESRTGDPPTKTPIARIAIKDGTLFFQWAKGLTPDLANNLRNCGLNISVDEKTRFLPLGRPQLVKPVVVNLDTGAARTLLPDDSLPERETLRLQVIRLEGGFPEPKFVPGDTVIANGELNIKFENANLPKFWLHVFFDAKTRPSVQVVANIDYEWQNLPPGSFRARSAGRVIQSIAMDRQKLVSDLEKTAPNDNKRKDELKKKLQPLNQKFAKFTKLNKLYETLKNQPGKVHFRVYTVIDEEHRVILMQSFTPSPKKPKGKASPVTP